MGKLNKQDKHKIVRPDLMGNPYPYRPRYEKARAIKKSR